MQKKDKVKKEPLKKRDPYKFYRNGYLVCKAGTIISITAPIVAIFGAKWNEYIALDEGNPVRLTIGAMLALFVAAIITYKYIKHDEKMKEKTTMLSMVVGIGLAFVITYLLKVVLSDLTLILGCEFAGAVAGYGFDLGAGNRYNLMKIAQDEDVRGAVRQKNANKEKVYNLVD